MRAPFRVWTLSFRLLLAGAISPAWCADSNQLMRLLESRSCQGCRLQDADLVQADLRDAKLKGAQLQRANLSGARLDGADLRGTNLSFTSLAGASLRGTDLRGSNLNGTDLRQADLSGALLDPGSLSRTHWQHATGINSSQHSYAELHNAGIESTRSGRLEEAIEYFNQAIAQHPDSAITWASRGVVREKTNDPKGAAQDFSHAAALYESEGDIEKSMRLKEAAKLLETPPKQTQIKGNGLGSKLISGAAAAAQVLGPIVLKAFIPMIP